MSQIISSNKNIVFSFFVIVFIAITVIAFLSDGAIGGGDHYVHYRMARYSWQHPEYFLDLWGKPVFTILASPFAQLGMFGVKCFNILCGLLSAIITYKISKKFELKNSLLAALFLLFMPTYFFLMMSSMTEVLFSLLLVTSIYLVLEQKFLLCALLVSLLPFSRQEGYAFLILFAVYFVYKKQWKIIPLLFSGIVLFSIIGFFVFNDVLWLMNNHPYPIKAGVYGYGTPWHFVAHSEDILGVPLIFLFCVGVIVIIRERRKKVCKIGDLEKHYFIYLFFVFFLAVHSFLWWRGLSGSLGLIRVMACVLPMAAIISLEGLNGLLDFIKVKPIISKLITYSFCIYILLYSFLAKPVPVPFSGYEKASKELAIFIKQNNLSERFICSTEVWLWYFLDKDPYNTSVIKEGVFDRNNPSSQLNLGSLIVYDNQFGPNHVDFEKLTSNSNLKLLYHLVPKEETIFADKKYECWIFEVI